MTETEIDRQLESLSLRLAAPADGHELAALIACESVRGTVALACWQAGGDTAHVAAQRWQVITIEDASVIDDAVLLRESLALVAMAETLAEHADPARLEGAAGGLDGWAGERLAGDATAEALAGAIATAAAAMRALAAAVAAPERGISASPRELDRIGGLMRELERTWTSVDLRAQQWSASAGADAHADDVHELWALLAQVTGGPLAAPVSTLLEQGREAGLALAADVTAG